MEIRELDRVVLTAPVYETYRSDCGRGDWIRAKRDESRAMPEDVGPTRRERSEGMVGATGFEPATPCAQGRCATRLRYAPTRPSFYGSFPKGISPRPTSHSRSSLNAFPRCDAASFSSSVTLASVRPYGGWKKIGS